jgi:hypothetical protein
VPALECINGNVTFSNSTETALTMQSGDSLTVRNFNPPNRAFILNIWDWFIVAGYCFVKSPRMHDNYYGIRARVPAALPIPLLPWQHKQEVFAQDSLTAKIYSADASGNIEQMSLELYYEDVPGINARLISREDLVRRRKHTVIIETILTAPITGLYSPTVALNAVATQDLLKANTDYAVLGGMTDVLCQEITLRGPDFGGLRVGVPGCYTIRHEQAHFFEQLAHKTGLPLIPVFNSANKAGTFAEGIANSAAALTINANWVLNELAPA